METTEIYISYENYCETLELIEEQYGKPYDIRDDVKTSIINMCIFDLSIDPLNCWKLMTDSYIVEVSELCRKLGIETNGLGYDEMFDSVVESEIEINDSMYRFFTDISTDDNHYIIMERF